MRKDVKKAKEYAQNSLVMIEGLMKQAAVPEQVKKKAETVIKNLKDAIQNMSSVENTYTNNI